MLRDLYLNLREVNNRFKNNILYLFDFQCYNRYSLSDCDLDLPMILKNESKNRNY
jgi:hypothetical protein